MSLGSVWNLCDRRFRVSFLAPSMCGRSDALSSHAGFDGFNSKQDKREQRGAIEENAIKAGGIGGANRGKRRARTLRRANRQVRLTS